MTGATGTPLQVGPLRVGGADVTVRTDSSEFAGAIRWAFADLATRPDAPAADRHVVFDVERNHGSPAGWAVHRDGEPCELELMETAVLVHLQWELNRLAIESRPTAIHSAAVARDGLAALLVGASHSGKTTLAGWLAARHGATYLTDEVAAIDDEGRVIAFPRPLGVRTDSPLASLAPPEDATPTARLMDRERLVPASVLGAAVSPDPTPIGLLVVPTFTPGVESTVESLDHADAFERVAALTPGLVSSGRSVFEQLCRMVELVPTIALRYGDVRLAAPIVAAALDEVSAL